MKASNYIIIAFFTFLFGGVLVLYVAAKFHDTEDKKLLSKENPLESFSVVVGECGSEFTLKNGNPKIMSFGDSTQDTCYLPQYEIRNDTLIVFPYKDENIHQSVEVYCLSLREIQGKENSNIELQMVQNDSLSINLDKARFLYNPHQNTTYELILKLMASDSYVRISSASLERLQVQVSHTKIEAWNNSIRALSGTLKNQSELHATVSKEINVESDSTCNFNIRK